MTLAKTDILLRYAKFFRGLRSSVSDEIRVLCNLICRDSQSTTAKNLKFIGNLSKQDLWTVGQEALKETLVSNQRVSVSDQDKWRIPYLRSLLEKYQLAQFQAEEPQMNAISQLIFSLAKG